MKLLTGIYCGTFSPFTIGHLSIVKQAIEIFDNIIVAQGINPEKNLLNINTRIGPYRLPSKFLETLGVKTDSYDTLLIDYIKKLEEQYNVVLIRGLRNGADLEYEQNIVAFLRGMHPRIKIVAFYCDPAYRHISSSALRDIQKFSESEYKKYVISD
jgi:pantetheine-phosphate adenylyltransferase